MSEQAGTSTDKARGFVASLLDLSFTEFITTRLVKVLYVLTLVGIVILYLVIAVAIFSSGDTATSVDGSGNLVTSSSGGDTAFGVLWLLVLGPLAVFLYTLLYRVFFELVIVIFRIFELNREQTELLRRMAPGDQAPASPPAASPSPGPSASQGPPQPPAAWGAPAG